MNLDDLPDVQRNEREIRPNGDSNENSALISPDVEPRSQPTNKLKEEAISTTDPPTRLN